MGTGNTMRSRVFITGASSGIGKATANFLVARGMQVVGTTRNLSKMPEEELKFVEMDVTSGASVAAGVKAAGQILGGVDVLINNAGILRDRMVFNMTEEEWDSVIKVHLYGVFNCSKHAAILMKQQRSGRIISMSSTSGLLGNSGQANYGAAKAGIAGFTRVCARDLGRYGVTVNVIAPAADTRMTLSEEVIAARTHRAQLGLTGLGATPVTEESREPEDVAPIVVYLCTDAAANINGCTFGARGGQISLHTDPVPIKTIYKDGRWTLDELLTIMPSTLAADLVNPAPPIEPQAKG